MTYLYPACQGEISVVTACWMQMHVLKVGFRRGCMSYMNLDKQIKSAIYSLCRLVISEACVGF